MSDSSGSGSPGDEKPAHERAKEIADRIAPLMREARSNRFDFLAYLLAMALTEARRLSRD
ncbi:MAG: hypothetical protein ACRECX_08430 [Methyloceanibacter sp.]|uniref:hypothetical protein n=1 Tax=Methyloceanibacter sp. TaxID=1965321 RepID=UPI003D6D5D33